MKCDIVGIDAETGNAIIKIRADGDKYTAAVLVQHNKIPQEFHGPRLGLWEAKAWAVEQASIAGIKKIQWIGE